MNGIIIYGAGGHAKVVIEIAEALAVKILGVYEDSGLHDSILGYQTHSVLDENKLYIIAIGSNQIRKKIATTRLYKFASLIHPRSNISTRVKIGDGTVIMAGVSINSFVSIGAHCIINTNVSVDHDCIIQDFVHLSPNVALAGTVTIGEGSHIGIGACVIQGVKIGKWCTVGAGTVVIKDIPDGSTVVGNPGRIIKEKSIEDL